MTNGYVSWHDEIALSTSCHDKTDNCPIFTESYKAKVCGSLCILLFFIFFLAQTSVYSNTIFCEVSQGEKQFRHPRCNLTHSPVECSRHLMLLSYRSWKHMIDAPSLLHSACRHLSLHPFFHPLRQSQMEDVLLPFPSVLSATVILTSSLFSRIFSLWHLYSPPIHWPFTSVYPLRQASSVLVRKQSKQKTVAKVLHSKITRLLTFLSLPKFWFPDAASTFVSTSHFNLVLPREFCESAFSSDVHLVSAILHCWPSLFQRFSLNSKTVF